MLPPEVRKTELAKQRAIEAALPYAERAAQIINRAVAREYDPSKYDAPKTILAPQVIRPGGAAFRKAVLERDKHCVITGCDITEALDAAHIKPSRLCEGQEYYDIENGLLLRADVHRLFDRGVFTIGARGNVITHEYRLRWVDRYVELTPAQQEYMAGHRGWYFRKRTNSQVR